MNFSRMKKSKLIELVVPAKIKRWEKNTPQYTHKGKEEQLRRIYWRIPKKQIIDELKILKALGYLK